MKKKSTVLLIVCIFSASMIFQTAIAQSWNLAGNGDANNTSKLGTTTNVPLNFYTNNKPRVIIDSLGNVGINTATPVSPLTVQLNGSIPANSWLSGSSAPPVFIGFAENKTTGFNLATAGNAANFRPVLNARKSRGTLAAPTAVINNDVLASFVASGHDGSNFQNPATIDFYVDGTPSAGSVPARISFVTGSNVSDRLERLKIGSTGDINISSGNLIMGSAAKTIQFAPPVVGSAPMMTMFPSDTQNPDRMVISHSPSYPTWGLQYQDTLDKFNFLSEGAPVLTADLGSERVGIGTSSPDVKLDIAGTGAYNLATSEGDFRLGNATYRLKMGVANAGGGAGDAYIASSNRLYLGAGSSLGRTQTLSINSNGRVGIGTFTPTARFQVVADTGTTAPVVSVVGSYTGLSDVRGITTVSTPAEGYGYGIQATGGFIGGYLSAAAGAYTGTGYGAYGASSGTAGTRIGVYGVASGGTVGSRIGVYGSASGGNAADGWGGYFPTKTYTSELRVGGTKGATGYVAAINGKLIAEEVRVDLRASWPDYVFEKGYKLMPIENLEAKINTDNHLPGLPAASEVKENGIMLGEMQTKTMEKIEENTLYIIQLNNKIKLLEKEKEEENILLNNKLKLLEKKIDELTKGKK